MTITETIARAVGLATLRSPALPPAEALIAQAEAAISALTEAGYAIVPVEPTEAMLEMDLFEAESCTNDWTASAACLPGHVWKAMLRAASRPLDSEKGE